MGHPAPMMRGVHRAILRLAAFALWLAFFYGHAVAREQYPGQYAQVDPHVSEWFRQQRSPGNGALCCSQADGTLAEEDIRGTHYWTRWPGQDWMQVPEEAVISNTGNPNGSAVVWWYDESGETRIRCFVPGSLM